MTAKQLKDGAYIQTIIVEIKVKIQALEKIYPDALELSISTRYSGKIKLSSGNASRKLIQSEIDYHRERLRYRESEFKNL